jgi:hypothetical protein
MAGSIWRACAGARSRAAHPIKEEPKTKVVIVAVDIRGFAHERCWVAMERSAEKQLRRRTAWRGSWPTSSRQSDSACDRADQRRHFRAFAIVSDSQLADDRRGEQNQDQRRHRDDRLDNRPGAKRLRHGHVEIFFHQPEAAVVDVREDQRARASGEHQKFD